MRKFRIAVCGVVIASGLVFAGVQAAMRAAESRAAVTSSEGGDALTRLVEVAPVRTSDWELWRSYYGQAMSAKTMSVTSFVRETVEAVHVNVGDEVGAGRVLLTLRRDDLAADARAAAAAYGEARLTHERLRALCREGGVSQSEVDRAYAVLKSEEAKSQNYRSALGRTQVRSEISGVVTARYVEPGEIAEPGRTMLIVEDLSDIEAQIMVSARDAGGIGPDTPVVITANGASSNGRVRRVNPKAQPGSGLCPVIVAIDPGAGVLPGTYLEGSFMIRRDEGVITVPSSAVFNQGDERCVYVADSEGSRARLVKIVTGSGRDGMATVTSGLKPGDLLITSGSRGLVDGVAVSFDLRGPGRD
jgi:RND family efflux transporter MFP subunit